MKTLQINLDELTVILRSLGLGMDAAEQRAAACFSVMAVFRVDYLPPIMARALNDMRVCHELRTRLLQ